MTTCFGLSYLIRPSSGQRILKRNYMKYMNISIKLRLVQQRDLVCHKNLLYVHILFLKLGYKILLYSYFLVVQLQILGNFYIKFKEKNIENIDLKNCWSGCFRCWAPKTQFYKYTHRTFSTLKQITHKSQSFFYITTLRIISLTTQPYFLSVRRYYHIYLNFLLHTLHKQNNSHVFLHRYYITLPNIRHTTSINHKNMHGHSSDNLYDANLCTPAYIDLETNTILLASEHNSYNRTIQVVPSL